MLAPGGSRAFRIRDAIARNPRHPRAESTALPVVGALAISIDESDQGFLGDVLGVSLRKTEAPGESGDDRAVPGIEFAPDPFVTRVE